MYEYLGPASGRWIPCGHCHYMGAVKSGAAHLLFQPSDAIASSLERVSPTYFRYIDELTDEEFFLKVKEVNKNSREPKNIKYYYIFEELTELEILIVNNRKP